MVSVFTQPWRSGADSFVEVVMVEPSLSWTRHRLDESLEREHALPVLLHVDDRPACGGRLIECLVELPDVRVAVVGPLPIAVGVVHEHREAGAGTGGRPLEHLAIA